MKMIDSGKYTVFLLKQIPEKIKAMQYIRFCMEGKDILWIF
jgi:hypothetical protein